MQFLCDANGKTWFRIETIGEAARESELMGHAVERHFREHYERAASSFAPDTSLRRIEQSIGRADHIRRTMPVFATLRDGDGKALVTAMLPPVGSSLRELRPIIVGPANEDPYPAHAAAIAVLGDHFGLKLERERCYPYRR